MVDDSKDTAKGNAKENEADAATIRKLQREALRNQMEAMENDT